MTQTRNNWLMRPIGELLKQVRSSEMAVHSGKAVMKIEWVTQWAVI